MAHHTVPFVLSVAALVVSASGPARAQAQAAPPATAQTTQVLATLTVKPAADRAQLMQTLPDEVRATVRLYLDGKIQQWFSRSDGSGVVFILNCGSIADAKAVTDTLPLSKSGLATFEYVGLGPLIPLRMLLAQPASPKGDARP